ARRVRPHPRRRLREMGAGGEGFWIHGGVNDVASPAAAAHAQRDSDASDVGLRKRYGSNEVVRGLTFAIRRGECFGLLGPNGAGKTTTRRCCLGLIDADAGTITMVGEPVPKAARKARIRV